MVPVGGRIPGARRPVPQFHAAGSGNQKIGCASSAPWSRSVSGAREQLVQTLISQRRTDEALSEIEQLSSSDEIARLTSIVYWMAGRRAEPTALLG